MRFVTRNTVHLIMALMLATCAGQAWAAKAGQILFSRGVATIVDAQDSARGARAGSDVFEGERVVTGRGGIVQISLTDGTLVGLRGNSDYLIKRQQYQPEVAEEEVQEESVMEQAGELFSGWMRVVTGAIGKANPERVSHSTSVATIGIRGTVFQVIHVPEEGLPGYPDTTPGTYLFLEEGEVQITGEGGTRTVRPGDVVFVPFGGGAPVPAPEKQGLFEDNELVEEFDEVEDYDGELDLTDLSEDLNDTVLERLTSLPPLFKPQAIGWNNEGSSFVNRFDVSGDPSATDKILAIETDGLTYYLTRMSYLIEGDAFVEAKPGLLPGDRGSHFLADGTQIHWGVWGAGDYTVDQGFGAGREPTFEPWHFMITDNVLALTDLPTAGNFTYDYVGGTSLTPLGGGNVVSITGGSVDVDFGATSLAFTINTDVLGTFSSVGQTGDLSALYGGFFSMANDVGSETMTMGGYFTGANAGGLVTTMEVNGNGTWYGTAAFAK